MRIRLTISLVVFNAILFGTLYVLDNNPAETSSRFETVIPEEVLDRVNRLSIERRNPALRWVLEKKGSAWLIVDPIEWKTNRFAVNRILNQLQFIERITSFSVRDINRAGQSLSDYGLAEPSAILVLTHDGMETKIKIGSSTKVGNRLYILSHDESEVFVVNRELLDSVTIALEDLRNQLVFDIPLFEIQSINLRRKSLPLRIVRHGEGWRFETPIEAEADTAKVETVLNKLSGIRLVGFHSPNPIAQGLDRPAIRITFEGNNRRETLLLGHQVLENSGEMLYYARLENNPSIFTVPSEPFGDLLQAQRKLRNRQLIRISQDSINGIEIAVGSESVRLQKLETGAWQVPRNEPTGDLANWPADPILIAEMLTGILGTKAVSFVTDAPSTTDLEEFGLEDPQREVRLISNDQTSVLLIGNLTGNQNTVFAKIADRPTVYEIDSGYIFPLLQTRPLHYRLRLFGQQSNAVKIETVDLQDLDGKRNLLSLDLRLEPKGPDDPKSNLIGVTHDDRGPVQSLLQYGKGFTVNSYITQSFTEGYDSGQKIFPWKYRLRLEIVLPGGEQFQRKSLTYFFTERMGASTQVGGSPDFEITFLLDQNLIDTLFHFTFERGSDPLDL
ncbi:MAG: hypothetical protein DF168_01936 [Candidatus Moanabacter tarae]|uniref:DUF4340 domain-containing protein n=1 Tax=Candidatus Moanibacter tarae TaxID=2200854 RepID=A0A2Z4AKE1_9BACT|nr:MAG: hypothetical protein DF168_01936 [Candidatus Moanabacter tarae]|tara:strand:+ start:78036 stop:79883 length:1848 start_codon:yes stop_codon:yes gene_type:complete